MVEGIENLAKTQNKEVTISQRLEMAETCRDPVGCLSKHEQSHGGID